MKREAARMRKWLLGAAPLMLAGSRLFPAGGAEAALFLWAAAGLLIPDRRRYPYVRKPRLGIARLFFACSAGVFLLEGTRMILARLLTLSPGSPDALPADAGAVFFSLSLASRLAGRPLPRKIAWPVGAALGLAAAWMAWRSPGA